MRTVLQVILGSILSVLYFTFFNSSALSFIHLPLIYLLIILVTSNVLQAYYVALIIGFIADLHYFNFGLHTLLFYLVVTIVQVLRSTIISDQMRFGRALLAFSGVLVYYLALYFFSVITLRYGYYPISWQGIVVVASLALVAALIVTVVDGLTKKFQDSLR